MATGIGNVIRALRKMRGMTTVDLAYKSGLGLRTVERYEREEAGLKIEILQSIANALGYEVHFTFKLKPKE